MDKDISYYRYKARKYKNKLKNLRQWAGAKAKTEGEANTTHDNLPHAEAKAMCHRYEKDDSVSRVSMSPDRSNEGRYVVSVCASRVRP